MPDGGRRTGGVCFVAKLNYQCIIESVVGYLVKGGNVVMIGGDTQETFVRST